MLKGKTYSQGASGAAMLHISTMAVTARPDSTTSHV
jgi:hypothetical protein